MAIEDESTTIKPNSLALRPGSIEKVFTDCVMDLGRIVVLDSIDILPDGFRVSCHDLYGQLPEIVEEQRRRLSGQRPAREGGL